MAEKPRDTKHVRVSIKTYDSLKREARATGQTMTQIVDLWCASLSVKPKSEKVGR
jgi:hypothetical protein